VLRRTGDAKGHEAAVAAIRSRDPRGSTLVGARVLLDDLQQAARAATPLDLDPLAAFLKRTTHKEVRFEGWSWIGWLLFDLKQPDQARGALETAWRHIPPAAILDFSQNLANVCWAMRSELKTADKKFLVDVAEAQAKHDVPGEPARPAGLQLLHGWQAQARPRDHRAVPPARSQEQEP
jgi:hypothetical protein